MGAGSSLSGNGRRGSNSYSTNPIASTGGDESDTSETISVESSFVGLVIGRGGENLKRIETETGTRVQFCEPDPTSTVRMCRVSGPPAARQHAKAEIQAIINDSNSGPVVRSGANARGLSGGDGAAMSAALTDGDTLQILVPDRTVGLIIGRGGETIRDLQDRSGCRVNIVNESQSVNGLRPVNLKGSPEAKQKAKELILEIVESDTRQPPNGGGRNPGSGVAGGIGPEAGRVTDTIYIPPEAVGLVIGKGGETIREIQNIAQCRVNIHQTDKRAVDRQVDLIGLPPAIEVAKTIIQEKVDSVPQQLPSQNPSQAPGQAQAPPQGQPQGVDGANGGGAADPYAAFGGYQNYVAMWYSACSSSRGRRGSLG
ncbi:hypothetical protein KEM52_002545 [Ascosphaera acerosa]|nr:hypothetical protein KEM52_002545 [Ascosphaera acerosa]